MLKQALTAVPQAETSKADELRHATFASLEGHACTEAAQALTKAVNEQVVQRLAHAEANGVPKTNRNSSSPSQPSWLIC